MIHTWKTLGLTAALTAALTAGSAGAQPGGPAGDPPKPDDPRQELDQLRGDTIRSFAAAKKDIDALREEVGRLRKDLDALGQSRPPSVGAPGDGGDLQAARREIEALKEQVHNLQKALGGLQDARPLERRTAGYGPAGDGAATATGSIVLTNTYPAEVTILVDGEVYPLAPGEKRVLAGRPAGAFTYEVLGVQPAVQRTLAAGGAFPIHVHP